MKMLELKNQSRSARLQSGFTMVEILVALGLSAGLLFGVLQIFDANRQSSRLQNAYGEVQEGGRIAMEMITRDIRMANSWGCKKGASTNHLGAVPASVKDLWGIAGVSGTNNVGGFNVDAKVVKPGTDVVSVSGSFGISDAQVRQPYMVNTNSNITINAGTASIPLGTELIISDCVGSDIFVNTEPGTETNGVISHGPALSHVYLGDAQVGLPFTHEYFIGQNAVNGWSLFRFKDGVSPAEELVRNVTDLQVLYGIDDDTNGSAEMFIDAPNVVQMGNVVSMRMQLTLDSRDDVGGGPLQKTFIATGNIRNKSLK